MAHFWCQENTNSDLTPNRLLAHTACHLLATPLFHKSPHVDVQSVNRRYENNISAVILPVI